MAKAEFLVDHPSGESSRRSFSVPAKIRYSMRFLQSISTGLATKMALSLFFRPIPFPVPKRENEIRAAAKRRILSTGKSDFELFEWEGQGPTVLLMHGWSGRCTQFFKLIEALQKAGFRVLGIDAPAHGDLKQEKTHMLEFSDAMEVVNRDFGPVHTAIGHSMGGMAIFNTFKRRDFEPAQVVIIGTPANINNVVTDFCNRLDAGQKVALGIRRYIEDRYKIKTREASTDFLAARYNPPGLIIHDTEDRDVPYENARMTDKSWPAAELVSTRGLGHRKILMNEEVIEKIIDFLA